MATWTVPAKLPYALFVAGDERLGEAARPALDRVLESLAAGPPPAVALRTWIVEYARMGSISADALRAQIPRETLSDPGVDPGAEQRVLAATKAMIVAAPEIAALDARAPWGLLVLAATLASATNGVVYDSGTFRLVPRAILEGPLDGFLLGSIKNHIACYGSIDTTGTHTATTLGLNKYGLFEIALDATATGTSDVGPLLVGLAQAVVDARPAAGGDWDLPDTFEVTPQHVARARNAEHDVRGGSVHFMVRGGAENDMYWRAELTGGTFDPGALQVAL